MKTSVLINIGSEILKKNKIVSHILDSEIILSKILNTSREKLLINQKIVNSKNITEFKSKIARRSRSEPIAYILGEKEFYSQKFDVNKHTLIQDQKQN